MNPNRLTFHKTYSGFLAEIIGEDWPEWIRELTDQSGVYIIRAADTGRILYVGESHTGRLKKTVLRHFQAWSGKTAGKRYNRSEVEIAIVPTKPAKAVTAQNALISQLDPRDNTLVPVSNNAGNPF